MIITGTIMGTGAPVMSKAGRTMCAIVLSDDLGLVRVYPIPADEKFPVWGKVSMVVERSATDNRKESYKILEWNVDGCISDRNLKREILDACVLKSGPIDPQAYMNQHCGSIAMIKLDPSRRLGLSMERRATDFTKGDDEFCWVMTQSECPNKPYVEWESQQGSTHKTHLLGREIYEGLRRNPSNPWQMFNNLQINNPDYQHWLLMGNMKDRRNVWVGVHLHRLKNDACGSIPLFSTITDGKPDAWPYCAQEHSNVSIVDGRQMMFTTDFMNTTNNHGNTLTAR